MEPITLRPEREQRTLWLLYWAMWFAAGFVLLATLTLAARNDAAMVFGTILSVWLTAMLLTLVWIPAFHRSLVYVIDSDTVRARGGVLWKRFITVPFTKITNLDITQGPVQRLFGVGTIHIQTAGSGGQDSSKAELRMRGMPKLEEVKEQVMERIRTYTIHGPDQARAKPPGQNEEQTLDGILNELVAIRKVLESRVN